MFLLAVLLDVVEFCRVRPRLREEVEVVREFLLKPLQMHAQCAFATYVVHAKVVVDSLARAHLANNFWSDAAIQPGQVPMNVGLFSVVLGFFLQRGKGLLRLRRFYYPALSIHDSPA